MAAQFPTVDVTEWDVDRDEPAGAEEKIWLTEPGSGAAWLYKPVTEKVGKAGTILHGDDWAEKASSELAALIGLPVARIELADRAGRLGVISRNVRPQSFEMQPGQVVLQASSAPRYVPGNVQGRPGHCLENIHMALDGALAPEALNLPFPATAFDVFAGYLVLDAWVANRDRHDENWSVLRPITGSVPMQLCPTYDQANSLGYNVPDAKRGELIGDRNAMVRWCERGTAWRFEHDPQLPIPTLVDLAQDALLAASPAAREHWLAQIIGVSAESQEDLLARTPRMSELARTFARTVLSINRERILNARL